jgi:hypothetical protein
VPPLVLAEGPQIKDILPSLKRLTTPIFGTGLCRCSCDVLLAMLFPPPLRELDDPQVEAALREAMIGAATGLTRIADTYLAAQ